MYENVGTHEPAVFPCGCEFQRLRNDSQAALTEQCAYHAARERVIERLQAEVERLRGLIDAAIKGYDFDCYCKRPSQCCDRIAGLMEQYPESTKGDDQKATQGPYVPGQERSGYSRMENELTRDEESTKNTGEDGPGYVGGPAHPFEG